MITMLAGERAAHIGKVYIEDNDGTRALLKAQKGIPAGRCGLNTIELLFENSLHAGKQQRIVVDEQDTLCRHISPLLRKKVA
jgi:hypothetical protein